VTTPLESTLFLVDCKQVVLNPPVRKRSESHLVVCVRLGRTDSWSSVLAISRPLHTVARVTPTCQARLSGVLSGVLSPVSVALRVPAEWPCVPRGQPCDVRSPDRARVLPTGHTHQHSGSQGHAARPDTFPGARPWRVRGRSACGRLRRGLPVGSEDVRL
jgi:hypothetical protein